MNADACSLCGSTTWVASVLYPDGTRECAACLVGLTPMLAAGIPIAPLGERQEPKR